MTHSQFQRHIADCRARAARGDAAAAAEFRRTYGPGLERIVARIARRGVAASEFEQQVLLRLDEVRRRSPGRSAPPDAVREVAGRVLDLMLDPRSACTATGETVRLPHPTAVVS